MEIVNIYAFSIMQTIVRVKFHHYGNGWQLATVHLVSVLEDDWGLTRSSTLTP